MKHFFYLQVLLFLWSFTCYSNLNAQDGLSLKLGINATTITNATFDNYDPGPGFAVGISAYREIVPDLLAISIETGISNENSRGQVEIAISEATHTINLDYWNTALLSKFQLIDGINIYLGLQYGYLILARNNFERPDVLKGANVTTSEFNQANWSALIGFGKRLSARLELSLRYCHGLSHITPYNRNNVMFNAMPPENFLKNVRTVQVCVSQRILGK